MVLLTACSGSAVVVSLNTADEAPLPTDEPGGQPEAPPTSVEETVPGETQPPDEQADAEFDPLTLILVLVGVGLLLAAVGALSRSSARRKARDAALLDDWRRRARGTYGKARWLHENMTAVLISRLGDVHFRHDDRGEALTVDDEAILDRWQQIERSVQETSSELYALEANPPATGSAAVVRSVRVGLRVLEDRIREGAKADQAYRRAEGSPELDTAQALDVKLAFDKGVREATAELEGYLEQLQAIV